MIRQIIIVGLTLAAVGIGTLWSSQSEFLWRVPIHEPASYAMGIRLTDGRLDVIYLGGGATLSYLERRSEFAGFYLLKNPGQQPISRKMQFELGIPLYFPCVLFAAYPAIVLVRAPLRRWRRRRKGLCLKCSYDLTGNVTGTCPECGSKIGAHRRKEGLKQWHGA